MFFKKMAEGDPSILPDTATSPSEPFYIYGEHSYTSPLPHEKIKSSKLLILTAEIKELIRRESYLETKLPRCKLVTERFHRLLASYNPFIIHSESNMLSSLSIGYHHWFLQINIDCDVFILDGTYRQFFEGENKETKNNRKRRLLPKHFIGSIEELHLLFNTNRELLMPIFLKNLKKKKAISHIEDIDVADLINEIYRLNLKPADTLPFNSVFDPLHTCTDES